jgi:hypothetical protein
MRFAPGSSEPTGESRVSHSQVSVHRTHANLGHHRFECNPNLAGNCSLRKVKIGGHQSFRLLITSI